MLISHDKGPRLPLEVLFSIFEIAAFEDRHSAHALAYVSRDASWCTAALRWRTVVLTTGAQVRAFWSVLLACKEADLMRQRITTSEEEALASKRLGSPFPSEELVSTAWLSLPSTRPGLYVENLFIELPDTEFPELCGALDDLRIARSQLLAEFLTARRGQDAPSWSSVQQVRLATSGPAARLSGILHHVPHLERLALGAAESETLSPNLQLVAPRELSLVYDGNEYVIAEILTWSIGSESVQWMQDADQSSSIRPFFGGLRRRLTHLHIVGLDQRSDVTGVEMPVKLLAPLCAGSLQSRSLLQGVINTPCCEGSIVPSDDATRNSRVEVDEGGRSRAVPTHSQEPSLGITHLRFDTRRFEFRPVDVFAMRLRPFFTSVRYAYKAASDPKREAMLQSWGVGGLSRLHLSWDQAPSSGLPSAEDVPWYRRARYAAVPTSTASSEPQQVSSNASMPRPDLNGGWPREARDVWTERSDRELAPTFQAELAQSIQTQFGWAPPKPKFRPSMPALSTETSHIGQQRSNREEGKAQEDDFVSVQAGAMVPRIVEQPTESERAEIDKLGAAVLREVAREDQRRQMDQDASATVTQTEHDASVPDSRLGSSLSYAVRAPSRILKLGGVASFAREQRLALFLDRARGGPGSWG